MTKRIFAALNVYHDIAPRSAALNMSIDEVLLEQAIVPTIRFYRWDHPALSFGYFGKFADVADYEAERDVVRRWTGGGIVFHGDDLTYSIIIPASAEFFAASPRWIYAAIHSALRDALSANGEPAELASVAGVADAGAAVGDRGYNGACFANPVQADVLVNGRKVAGAAQRRTRRGLLQQGSIQLATGRVRPTGGHVDLEKDFETRFARALSDDCNVREVSAAIIDRAREIAARKYAMVAWLRRC
jgi:lipoate-protein ligase A